MIHWSALHGTRLLAAVGTALVQYLRLEGVGEHSTGLDTSSGSTQNRFFHFDLAENVLATATSLISDDSARRGMLGGYTLDGQIVSIIAREPGTMALGIMAVWAAGGVAHPKPYNGPCTSTSFDDAAPHPYLIDDSIARETIASMSEEWVTKMDIAQPDERPATSGDDVELRCAEWLKDLEQGSEDTPALSLTEPVGDEKQALTRALMAVRTAHPAHSLTPKSTD